MTYFVVHVRAWEEGGKPRKLIFDYKCTKFSLKNPRMCFFMHEYDDGTNITLGAIPYESILLIERVEE